MRRFKEGDRNMKFFHAYVRGRRIKLRINEIQDKQEEILQKTDLIGEEAVRAFTKQLSKEKRPEDYSMLEFILNIILEEQNQHMTRPPTQEEIKDVIFSMSNKSASGSDGYSDAFFQECWDIIK